MMPEPREICPPWLYLNFVRHSQTAVDLGICITEALLRSRAVPCVVWAHLDVKEDSKFFTCHSVEQFRREIKSVNSSLIGLEVEFSGSCEPLLESSELLSTFDAEPGEIGGTLTLMLSGAKFDIGRLKSARGKPGVLTLEELNKISVSLCQEMILLADECNADYAAVTEEFVLESMMKLRNAGDTAMVHFYVSQKVITDEFQNFIKESYPEEFIVQSKNGIALGCNHNSFRDSRYKEHYRNIVNIAPRLYKSIMESRPS